MIFNLIQEKTLNPFNFVPEEKRPVDWQTLDQIRSEGGEAPAEGGEGGEGGGEDIPPEAQQAFGGGEEGGGEETPPAEGEAPAEGGTEGGEETPPAEGEGEPVEGADEIDKMFDSLKTSNGKNSMVYQEALNKAKSFSAKKLKKMQDELEKKISKEKLMKNPAYTVPMYSENYLELNLEFKGMEKKNIHLG